MWKLIVFLSIFHGASKALQCSLPNLEKTRTFDSIIQYQSNKNSFDASKPDWIGSSVNFTFSPLKTLETNMFVTFDSQSIIKMDLSYKQTDTIKERAFASLDCLHELKLTNNNISEISRNNFQGLAHLQKLYFNHNRLQDIPDATFMNLSTLLILDLSHNRLKKLNNLPFQYLTRLERLDLSHNQLVKISGEVFAPLKKLHTLNFSFNRLSDLEAEKWQGLIELQYLDLSGNDLRSFDASYNFSFDSLKLLNLSSNLLTQLNVLEMKRHLSQLGVVDLNSNDWRCDDLTIIVKEFKDSFTLILGRCPRIENSVAGICCDYSPRNESTTSTTTTTIRTTIPTEKTSTDISLNEKILEENKHILANLESATNLIIFLIVIVLLFALVEFLLRSRICEGFCKMFQSRSIYLDDNVETVHLIRR